MKNKNDVLQRLKGLKGFRNMTSLMSQIKFTQIAIKNGLNLNIIHYILSMYTPTEIMHRCDLCKMYNQICWYEKTCIGCLKSSISCCRTCYSNDIIIDYGKYCSSCKEWWCAKCCNKYAETSLKDNRYGHIECKCSKKMLCFRDFKFPLEEYDYKKDTFTKRYI